MITGGCQRLICRGASEPPGPSGSGEAWVGRSVHTFPEHCHVNNDYTDDIDDGAGKP